ncbi:universal stress protein [Natronorubrum texcoconense]|uniref:Nucleotide-binding universal stress protein, UspA family n=1 Tax=Natronorubrum texcoconense TaxID=1095776 RepID=A0A1G8TNF5_9EURY|nr:universal stress protein [Natronorubrum texcoconense]SDJ42455.1 Nucleotide-binding universal stress protein, UspA family [Natronorubrum texcoconense]
MYNVLLPVDENDDRANEQVDAVLSLPGDTDEISVTVLHIIEEIDTMPDEAGATVIDDVNESLSELQDVPDSVDAVERRLEDAGVETIRQVMVGQPAEGIRQIAQDEGADAIVLGTRKRSPVGKAVFGSVTQSVILEADRPVIVAN